MHAFNVNSLAQYNGRPGAESCWLLAVGIGSRIQDPGSRIPA